MDLHEAWKNLNQQKLSVPVAGHIHVPSHSRHPAAKLIQSFGAGLIFCIAFEALFVYLLLKVDQPLVRFGIATIIGLYLFLFFLNFKSWRRLRKLYRSDAPVITVLENVRKVVNATISFQRKLSWGFFPLCVAGGFLLGLSIKKDAATMIVQPKIYLTLLATMLVVTPACYALTKWLTKIAYGKYLKQIDDLIREMKEL